MKRLVIVKVNTMLTNDQEEEIKQSITQQLDKGLVITDFKCDVFTKYFADADDVEVVVKPKRKRLFRRKK